MNQLYEVLNAVLSLCFHCHVMPFFSFAVFGISLFIVRVHLPFMTIVVEWIIDALFVEQTAVLCFYGRHERCV